MENFGSGRYKIGQDDRNAIADAIKALDKKTLADNLKRLSASSALLAKGFLVEIFCSKIEEDIRTNNWKPLMLEIEAMALSGVAVAAMSRFIPHALLTIAVISPSMPPMVAAGLVVFLIASLASLINANLVDKLNNEIDDAIDALRPDY